MARVNQARDLRLGRAVAVKMVSPEITDAARWAATFSDEARAVARLSHPNVVTVFRAGEWQGQPFLVMELLELVDREVVYALTPNGGGLGGYYLPDLVVTRLVATQDRARVLTLSGDRYARLWDGATGRPLGTLSDGEGRIQDAALHPRGDRLATASSGGVSLWSLDGAPLGKLEGLDARRVTYSPGGDLVVGTGDGALHAYGAHDQPLWQRPSQGSPVSALAWSSEGGVLSGGQDGRVRVWSASGQLVATLSPHGGPVLEVSAFGSGGYSTGGTTTQLFDAGGQLLRSLDNGVRPIAARHPRGELLFASGPHSELWAPDGEIEATLTEQRGSFNSVEFSPDGTRLLTASPNLSPQIWDLDGKLLHTLEGGAPPITVAHFSPDGTSVVAGSFAPAVHQSPIQLWGADGTRREVLGRDRLLVLGFSPDARRLLSWSDDAAVQLYELDAALLLARAQERLAQIPQVTPDLGQAGAYGSLY